MEKRTEKSEERVEEMSKDEKRKLYLDEFHNIKGMDTETYRKMGSTYKIKKLDLSKDTEKFNPFDTDSLMLKKWNKITRFKDCPPLNTEVMAIHDGNMYIAVFEKDRKEGFCWRLENENVIQWVDLFEVDYWFEYKMSEQ